MPRAALSPCAMLIEYHPRPGFRYELDVEARPHRGFSSINVQFEAKEVFDILLAHHVARSGRALRQPDFFNVVLGDYLERHAKDLPVSLQRPGARGVEETEVKAGG